MVLDISRPKPVRFIAAGLLWAAVYDEFVKKDGPWGGGDYAVAIVGGYVANALIKEVM
jgi:hypothetical protein